ncbi:MAG: TonB-dependent receptor [Bacteroidales bacterium]|nr:TonB-dependent receptor [Bacteroidales bacterium]
MRRIFPLFLSLFVCAAAVAQKTQVVGRVLDSEEGEALAYATIQIMKPDSTSMVTGGTTNGRGAFQIKNVPVGSYIVRISYIGYHNFFHPLTVKEGQLEAQVGTVLLTPSSVMLQTAVVEGQVRQIEMKDDTLVFNANAFKVPEGSVLEELIKKLPGVEVSDDGTIKVNGKTVSKILVGGKEFFGNDRNMAMKNLPSEIVDKVKTYDKQSDMARMTGIDDGEEETVIDLTVKKGMQNGWIGNADLAGGTQERFAERVMASRFSPGKQFTAIGNIGNAGGRGGGGGVRTTGQGGVTLATEVGKVEIGGNVRVNGSKTDSRTTTSSQNFISTTASFSNSQNGSISKSKSLSGDFRIEWKPDSMTTLNFRPNFSFGDNNSHSNGLNTTYNDDPYMDGAITNPLDQFDLIPNSIKVNRNLTGSRSEGENNSLSGRLILNRRLNNVGRNISLNLNGSYSSSESRNFNLSDVTYYQRGTTELTYRYRTTPNTNKSFSAGINYTEPLIAKKLFLQGSYRINYSKRRSEGTAYDMGSIAALIDSIRSYGAGYLPFNYEQYADANLSRYTQNENTVHNIDLQLRLVTTYINMNVGVSIEPQHQKVAYQYMGLDTVASRNFIRISPTLNFRYRFTRQHQIRIRYRGQTQQPEMTSMFAMTDNSNPLNIRLGNPELKPSFSNNIQIDYNNYVSTTLQSYTANIRFTNTLNSISNRTEYNPVTGGRITKPENINGNWNVNGTFGFNTPLYDDNFFLNTSTSVGYTNNVGYIYQNNQTLTNKVRSTTAGERLSFNYRSDLFDVRAFGNLNYNHTRSMLVPTNNRDTYDFSYGLSTNWNFESGLAFSTDIGMSSRRGYSAASMNTNELIWNAQVSYRFLERRNATVMLQAFDLLHRRSNISRQISATSRSDSENNSINSYVMLHFIYRFNLFGTREARQEMRRQRNEFRDD